jgi:Tfp pilus assembly protein PilF
MQKRRRPRTRMSLQSALTSARCICISRLAIQIVLFLSLTIVTGMGLPSRAGDSATQNLISGHLQTAPRAMPTGNFAEAETELRAVLSLEPDNTDASGTLGVVLFFQSRWNEAAEHFRVVLKGRQLDWKIQALLGMCDRRPGQTVKARRLLAEAVPRLQDTAL